MIKAAFLDTLSVHPQDLDFSTWQQIPGVDWQFHDLIDAKELENRIDQYDIIISNKIVLAASQLEKARRLKLICVAATGTNNIDLQAAARFNIAVSNVRGYANNSVAQFVLSALLHISSHFAEYSDAVRQRQWHSSPFFCLFKSPIEELSGKKIGIIGYGNLGKSVAKLASAFGMEILIAQGHSGKADSTRVSLEHLLQHADFVSLHCPLTDETRGLIGERQLELMKESAWLINSARGGIVDEHALLEALSTKQIAGAILDVLEQEPPAYNQALINQNLENLLITPHIAWASRNARQQLVNDIGETIAEYLRSGTVRNKLT